MINNDDKNNCNNDYGNYGSENNTTYNTIILMIT